MVNSETKTKKTIILNLHLFVTKRVTDHPITVGTNLRTVWTINSGGITACQLKQ